MLLKRGDGYYSRLWVPLDVRGLLGRSELKKSLKTTDRKTAKAQDKVLAARLEQFCLRVRVGVMTEKELERLAADLIGEFIGRMQHHKDERRDVIDWLCTDDGNTPPVDTALLDVTLKYPRTPADISTAADWYTARINQLEGEIATEHYSRSTRYWAKRLVTDKGLDVELPPLEWFEEPGYIMPTLSCPLGDDSELMELTPADDVEAWNRPAPAEFNNICLMLLQAQVDSFRHEMEKVQGKRNTPLQEQVAARVEAARPKPKLSDLWEAYSRKKIGGERWTANTAQKNLDEYSRAVKLLGDRELHCYDDSDAMDLIEMLKAAGLKPKSVNYAPELLSAMWKFALDKPKQWHVEYNPFKGLQVADNREDHAQKDPYGVAEIEGMFRGLSKVRRLVQPERFWVPLICLYSGMRSNEACQLRVEDVEELDGVLMFHIRHRPDMDQTTKNKKSRWCPVHPVLIRLGLKRYLDQQVAKKQERLFSNLKLYRGKWHKDVGNWYNRTLEPKYTTNEKHSLHSLRHTFVDWHKHNNLSTRTDEHVLKAIVGHTDDIDADGGITLNRYGTPYSPKTMLKFLQALDYGVDLELCKNKYGD